MGRLRAVDGFAHDPVGTYVQGRTFAVWCAAPDLVGIVQWGVPEEHDVRDMFALVNFERHTTLAARVVVLVDNRAVERVDPDGMLKLLALLRDQMPQWSSRISRQAVIVPEGLRGLLLAGAMPLLAPGFPFEFSASLDAALAFADHPLAKEATQQMAEVATAQSAGRLVARLRAVIERDLVHATVGSAAANLRLSERSLQRALTDSGTSFSDELRKARVAVAAELLRSDPDVKIDVIARRVGFGTSSRLATALRRELGVTAASLRPGAD